MMILGLWLGAGIGAGVTLVFCWLRFKTWEASTRAVLRPFVNGVDVYNEGVWKTPDRRLWLVSISQLPNTGDCGLIVPARTFAGSVTVGDVWAAANHYQALGGILDYDITGGKQPAENTPN